MANRFVREPANFGDNSNSPNPNIRWQGGLDSEDWSKERIRVASGWIKAKSKVADLGCGTQVLAKSLHQDCQYTGLDIGNMNSKNVHLDLNKEFDFHEFFDVAVLLGVLEYLEDPISTIKRLKEHCNEVIISYVCAKESNSSIKKIRERIGVTNHLTESDLRVLLEGINLLILNEFTIWNNPGDKHLMFHMKWHASTK